MAGILVSLALASKLRAPQGYLPSGTAEMEKTPKKGLRSLLGVLAFMGRYPGRVAGCIALLLVNISIEMSLPQIIGSAVTNLRWHMEWGAEFPRNNYVLLFLSLVLIRAAVGHLLGPARNRLVQTTLGDVRSAI